MKKTIRKQLHKHEALLLIDAKSIKAIISKFMADENTRAVIITDGEGLPIQSSFKGKQIEHTEEISAYITSLIGRAKQTVMHLGKVILILSD